MLLRQAAAAAMQQAAPLPLPAPSWPAGTSLLLLAHPCLLPAPSPPQVGVRTNEEREQTLNQLLSEMDGFTPDSGACCMLLRVGAGVLYLLVGAGVLYLLVGAGVLYLLVGAGGLGACPRSPPGRAAGTGPQSLPHHHSPNLCCTVVGNVLVGGGHLNKTASALPDPPPLCMPL